MRKEKVGTSDHSTDSALTGFGAGELQTYWIKLKDNETWAPSDISTPSDQNNPSEDSDGEKYPPHGEKYERLIEWTVSCLGGLLQKVVERRASSTDASGSEELRPSDLRVRQSGCTLFDEVREVIELPPLDEATSFKPDAEPSTELPADGVTSQLRSYVEAIAKLYRVNP